MYAKKLVKKECVYYMGDEHLALFLTLLIKNNKDYDKPINGFSIDNKFTIANMTKYRLLLLYAIQQYFNNHQYLGFTSFPRLRNEYRNQTNISTLEMQLLSKYYII